MRNVLRSISSALERAFSRVFVRATMSEYGVRGTGAIERRDGSVTPFKISGDVSPSLLAELMPQAMRRVFGMGRGPFSRMLGAVTHPTAVRTAVADLVVDRIDAGAAAGHLVFNTSGDVEVATLTFSDPAFGNAASGTATANAITSDTSATGGTVAKFVAEDSDGTDVFLGAVGTSGSDINLSSLAVGASDTVSMSSLTYSAAA